MLMLTLPAAQYRPYELAWHGDARRLCPRHRLCSGRQRSNCRPASRSAQIDDPQKCLAAWTALRRRVFTPYSPACMSGDCAWVDADLLQRRSQDSPSSFRSTCRSAAPQ